MEKKRDVAPPNAAIECIRIELRVKCEACGIEYGLRSRTKQAAAAEAFNAKWTFHTHGSVLGWRCPDPQCRMFGRRGPAPPSDGIERSRGHLCFAWDGRWEFFEARGEVYRSRTHFPIGVDGRRPGRWVCSVRMFEEERPDRAPEPGTPGGEPK